VIGALEQYIKSEPVKVLQLLDNSEAGPPYYVLVLWLIPSGDLTIEGASKREIVGRYSSAVLLCDNMFAFKCRKRHLLWKPAILTATRGAIKYQPT
jgi:hypothetical protein